MDEVRHRPGIRAIARRRWPVGLKAGADPADAPGVAGGAMAAAQGHVAGVPPVRVGWLLARARRETGFHQRDVAAFLGVPTRLVRRWEAGATVPTDEQLEALASLYRRSLPTLLPPRDVVALDHGALRVGDTLVPVQLGIESNEAILRRYVDAVRAARRLGPDDALVLRREDVAALAGILDVHDDQLERDLVAVVGLHPARAAAVRHQLLRRRLAVPVATVAIGVGGVLGVANLGRSASGELPAPVPAAAVTVDPGAPGGEPVSSTTMPVPAAASAPAMAMVPPSPAPASVPPPAPAAGPVAPAIGDAVTLTPTPDATTVEPPAGPVAVPTVPVAEDVPPADRVAVVIGDGIVIENPAPAPDPLPVIDG